MASRPRRGLIGANWLPDQPGAEQKRSDSKQGRSQQDGPPCPRSALKQRDHVVDYIDCSQDDEKSRRDIDRAALNLLGKPSAI